MGGCWCVGRCHRRSDGDIRDGEAVDIKLRVQSVDTTKNEYDIF